MQGIPRDPTVFAPPTIHHIDLDFILDDLYNHIITQNARSLLSLEPWNVAFDYIKWFYKVSHPYMTSYIVGAPPKTTHSEILEEE